MGGAPMLYGVDVHDGYQAGLSFPLLRQQGYTFATIKLTQGTNFVRPAADGWIRAAGAAGLIPGAYHWLTAADGAAQARWFHHHVVAAGGPRGLLIQLDVEDDGYGPQMRAWADEWARLTGGHPFVIYSGSWWWPRTGGYRGADLTRYLWHSHYLTADLDTVPDDPAAFASRIPASWWAPGYGGWEQATLLQFTSKGDAGALANRVDLNVTRLTREQLLALTRSGVAPQPQQEEDDMPMYFRAVPSGRVCSTNGTSWHWLGTPKVARSSTWVAEHNGVKVPDPLPEIPDEELDSGAVFGPRSDGGVITPEELAAITAATTAAAHDGAEAGVDAALDGATVTTVIDTTP